MRPLKASFIVPFYNNGITLGETITSIQSQTYSTFDIWIINDGSTDEQSLAVLKRYESAPGMTILHQANAGPSIARNLAIRQSDADIIVPLDADDLIRPDALRTAMDLFTTKPETDVIYGQSKHFGESTDTLAPGAHDMKRLLVYNYIPLCTFIRRDLFETCGYFDEYMSKLGLEDWELWIRALGAGKIFYYHPEVMFDIRVSQKSRTYTQANKNLDLLRKYVYEKNSEVVLKVYSELFYENEWRKQTIEHRIRSSKIYQLAKSILKAK